VNQALETRRGTLALPTYLPDATRGVVRAIDARDVHACGITALVMNVFHLMQRPGSSTIAALGGLHRMSGWSGPIVTDSGGFQAYSLIRQHGRGTLNEQGLNFTPEGADRRFQLTPEKSVQLQLAYGADVVICLDDCTHAEDSLTEQEHSVRRTIAWARRCKDEFEHQVAQRRRHAGRPLLFAVIQGGASPALRRQCADALLEIGFDGYGYGGWPLAGDGSLLREMLALTRELIPPALPLHALGVGHPDHVATCARMGYDLFDSALPTRDARAGRLYRFADQAAEPTLRDGWRQFIYLEDERHLKSAAPIDAGCDCHTCQTAPLGYLYHLRAIGDGLFARLATIHNLRFMSRLVASLQRERAPA
jgi:queuine tRNA-ribosyltransferase